MGRSTSYFLAAAMMCILHACNDDTPDYPTPYTGVEIVTVEQNEEGMILKMQRSENSEEITLVSRQYIPTPIERGRRIQVSFSAEMEDTAKRPMPVTLTGYRKIEFDTVRAYPGDIEHLPVPEGSIISQWRTGNFINLQTAMHYNGTTRTFYLVADGSTLSQPTVDLYLASDDKSAGQAYVERRMYGSFFIGDLDIKPDQRIRVISMTP